MRRSSRPSRRPSPNPTGRAGRRRRAALRRGAPARARGARAFRAGAADALRALADELGAVLGTSLPASGLFRGHPADLGLVGGFARPSVQEAVNACDVVLAVGAGLNGFTTHQESLMADAHVIHVDRDPAAFGRHRGVSSTITGDARAVAEALLARVRARDGAASSVRRVPRSPRRSGGRARIRSRTSRPRACSTRARCAAGSMRSCRRTARS